MTIPVLNNGSRLRRMGPQSRRLNPRSLPRCWSLPRIKIESASDARRPRRLLPAHNVPTERRLASFRGPLASTWASRPHPRGSANAEYTGAGEPLGPEGQPKSEPSGSRSFRSLAWSVRRRSDIWVLALWTYAGYHNQRQIQVAHLGEHAVQRRLIYDVSREHGLSVLQVGDL